MSALDQSACHMADKVQRVQSQFDCAGEVALGLCGRRSLKSVPKHCQWQRGITGEDREVRSIQVNVGGHFGAGKDGTLETFRAQFCGHVEEFLILNPVPNWLNRVAAANLHSV